LSNLTKLYRRWQTPATTKVLQHPSILFANIFTADYQNDVGETAAMKGIIDQIFAIN